MAEGTDSRYSLTPYQHLLQFKTMERWLRFKAPSTKHNYCRYLTSFLDFIGAEFGVKDPDSFLLWAKAQPDSLLVQDALEKFAESVPRASRNIAVMTPRSFLRRNGYTSLPSMSGPAIPDSFHRGYRREEVNALLGYIVDKRKKLYVLAAKDSGLRASDLLNLRYRHVAPDLEKGLDYVHLYLSPEFYNRRKASGLTFLGPNTVTLLKELIKDSTIKCNPETKIFPFSYNAAVTTLRLGRNKAGLPKEIQPNHGLRKFFENALDKVGMDLDKKRQLEGHSIGVKRFYADREIEALRTLYKAGYKFLDLTEKALVSDEVESLERKIGEQSILIGALERKLGEQSTLEDRYKGLLNTFGIQIRSELDQRFVELLKDPDIQTRINQLVRKIAPVFDKANNIVKLKARLQETESRLVKRLETTKHSRRDRGEN